MGYTVKDNVVWFDTATDVNAKIRNIGDVLSLATAGITTVKIAGKSRVLIKDADFANLCILNYTHASLSADDWTFLEYVSRGMIVNRRTGKIVSRPFDKFFNLPRDTRLDFNKVAEISEKMDGVMGSGYLHAGKWRVATRGSFSSREAKTGQRILDSKHDMKGWPANITPIWEIISPETHIVVDYADREELVLIGARNFKTGKDLFLSREVTTLANNFGFTLPNFYSYSSLESLKAVAARLSANREGFVVRMVDGTRWKVKGDAYLEKHRSLLSVTPKVVLSAMLSGTLDSFIEGQSEYYRIVANSYRDTIEDYIREQIEEADKYKHLLELPNYQFHTTVNGLKVSSLTASVLKAMYQGQSSEKELQAAAFKDLQKRGWVKIRHIFN